MSIEVLLPFLAVFGGVALLFMATWFVISSILERRRLALQRRLGPDDSEHTLMLEDALRQQRQRTLMRRFDMGFTDLIERTGLEIDPALAASVVLFCGIMLAAFVFIWRFEVEPWLAFPAFLVGAAIPVGFFLWRRSVWQRQLQDQLPDTLFLLARTVRAGRSIDQAFQLVGEQGVMPMSKEFGRMARQMELGLPLGQVLESTSQRLALIDFSVFASILSLHRATGGNLPLLLDRLASSARDRNQFEGQYRAATAMSRHGAWIIFTGVAVIMLFLFFAQRDMALRYFDFSEGYAGIVLFGIAWGLILLGALMLRWFLKHEF